ncbi:MAG: hypothetical protein ACRC41_14670 [Sarcina sp.]
MENNNSLETFAESKIMTSEVYYEFSSIAGKVFKSLFKKNK